MDRNSGRVALAAAVITPLVTVGVGMGSGTAPAATPPTISVTPSGTDSWTIAWDGTATPQPKCTRFLGPTKYGPFNEGTGSQTLQPAVVANLGPGAHKTFVECPEGSGNKSPTVILYAPRDPINDMRTQFSNDTQGMFNS